MRRRSVSLGLLLLLTSLATGMHAEELAENQARIGVVTGDVGLLTQGAIDWIEAKEGLPLESGDRLRTGDDGTVEVVAGDVALWVLQPQSDMQMEYMKADEGRFQLSSGTLMGSVDSSKAAGRGQHWEINTPMAAAIIRGTQFALYFSKAEGTRIAVYEGLVEMQPAETAEGVGEATRVSAGQEAFIPRGKSLKGVKEPQDFLVSHKIDRAKVRKRHLQVMSTWTAYTPTVRSDLRKKYVGPPPKRPAKPRPTPRRRSSNQQ